MSLFFRGADISCGVEEKSSVKKWVANVARLFSREFEPCSTRLEWSLTLIVDAAAEVTAVEVVRGASRTLNPESSTLSLRPFLLPVASSEAKRCTHTDHHNEIQRMVTPMAVRRP